MFGLRGKFLLGAVITIVAVTTTAAEAVSPIEMGMQTLYNPDGSGKLFAMTGNTAWERCNTDLSVCESAGTNPGISTGGAPDGTVFRLQGSATGVIWHGNLSIATPPSVQGALRANELVTPVLASWQGGWDGSFDQTQLAVCGTPTGEGCISISDHKYIDGCKGGGAVLDPSFAGRYLRVADRRMGPGTIETRDAYASPFGHPILPAERDTAVAIVGQIGPATHARTADCGPKSLVGAWISSRGVAKVSCPLGCQATLVARHGRRTARATLKIPLPGHPEEVPVATDPEPSGATLRLTRRARNRLGAGTARFAVEVGGRTFASRTVEEFPRHNHPKHKP